MTWSCLFPQHYILDPSVKPPLFGVVFAQQALEDIEGKCSVSRQSCTLMHLPRTALDIMCQAWVFLHWWCVRCVCVQEYRSAMALRHAVWVIQRREEEERRREALLASAVQERRLLMEEAAQARREPMWLLV